MTMRSSLCSLFAPLLAVVSTVLVSPEVGQGNEIWPQWRGPQQRGLARGGDFPIRWSESDGLAWKRELPGRGGSTPVVADGTAYLTAGYDDKNHLLAIDTATGDTTWTLELGEDRGHKHRKGSGSNPSAVIDGDLIFAYFRSGDLGCVNADGSVVWRTNIQDRFGEDELWWDLGNSPLLTESAVVLVAMQTPPSPSYLVAFDKQSGEVLWKIDRQLGAPKEAAQSYTTPIAVTVGGKEAIAVMGADHLTLHDASNGELLGKLGGFNPSQDGFFRSISSPVAYGNIIVCPYARGDTVTAVDMEKLAAGGGDDAIVWFRDDLGSDVPTPAIADGHVYVVNDGKAAVHCLDLESGETVWELRTPRSRISFSSSPLVAGNHLYVTSENATTYVIGPLDGRQPTIVSENEVADSDPYTVASPVPVEGGFLLRTRHRLYRVGG